MRKEGDGINVGNFRSLVFDKWSYIYLSRDKSNKKRK